MGFQHPYWQDNPANRLDIVVKTHNDKTCFLIDMSVPRDTNVSLKIFVKLIKYKDLKIGHQNVASQINNTASMVAKTAPNYVSQIPGVFLLYIYLIPNIYNKLQT